MTGKDMEGSGRNVKLGTIPAFAEEGGRAEFVPQTHNPLSWILTIK
jgi:hypothetical protein